MANYIRKIGTAFAVQILATSSRPVLGEFGQIVCENCLSPCSIGFGQLDVFFQPTRSKECGVNSFREIARRDDDDHAVTAASAVHCFKHRVYDFQHILGVVTRELGPMAE